MTQVGLIGLGKMGAAMRDRLRIGGHEVLGYDTDPAERDVATLGELVTRLAPPRLLWIMVPAGEPTRSTVAELATFLAAGDLVIEGGNSRFDEDHAHAELLGKGGIGYLDVGVSGGVWGAQHGFALMVGGSEEHVARAMAIFDTLRPDGPRGESVVHAGAVGAGHYAKMVHNGVEYGLMQAYAEGFELLGASEAITDVAGVITAWSRGTVVRSWLLELLAGALRDDEQLASIRGYVEDSGEGRWTVAEAVNRSVPAPVITAALFARFASRQDDSPAMRAVAALRGQFGGHAVAHAEEHDSGCGSAPQPGRATGNGTGAR